MNMPVLVWLILSAIWGSTWLFIKLGLEDLPPFTFAGLRFVAAVIPLIIWLSVRRAPLPRAGRDWAMMIGTGILTFSLNYGLVFWGENFISSGLTAILYTTLPLFGLLIAHISLPGEPLTLAKVFGVLLGIGGVALIFSHQLTIDDPMALWGSAAIVAASLGTAYAGVLIKARGGHLDPVLLTTVQMVVGLLPLLFVGVLLEGNPLDFSWTPMAWLSLLYLAWLGSSLAFVLLYWLIQNMEVTKTQLIPLMSTLIAVALGWLVLQEELGWRAVVGGAGVLLGLVLATRTRPHRRAATPRASR
jgi:drug/metabolite transporter (DMT)-like permease